MGISKRMKAEQLRGESPLKGLEAPECSGPHPFPATLSPIGWDCQEGGRGPYRGPLSALRAGGRARGPGQPAGAPRRPALLA